MATMTRAETAQWLATRDRFVILTHRRPDGDTIGSAAALCLGLRQLGKTAHVLVNAEVTPKYAPLLEGITKVEAWAGDTVIAVDVAAFSMLPEPFKKYIISLRIDHHENRETFSDNELVDPSAAACGDIIYDILQAMQIALDAPIANALYTAVSTDTGCFRFPNTTSHTFRVAAACADASKDIFAINQALFDTNSLARLQIQGYLVANARFLQEGKVVICPLPRSIEQEFGATEDDLENISGFPRSIEGVKLAVTLREEPNGRIKISARAVPGCDAAELCAKFGGGGHKGAAGANMDCTMAEAVEKIIAAIPVV